MILQSYSIQKGIISALIAAFTFSILYAIAKSLSSQYHISQIVFFRYLTAMILALVYSLRYENKNDFKLGQQIILQHAVRGILGMISAVLLFYAFTLMPLGDAISLNFSSSLFLCLLSWPILKEKVTFHRWIVILFGFTGVLIIANPTGEVFNYGTILVLMCALIDAYVLLRGRLFSRTMPIGIIAIYYSGFAALSSATLLPFVWTTPSLYDFSKLILVGFLGGIGQLFLTQAFKSAPASVIGPICYTSMIWSVALGYILWDEIPSPSTLVGSGIIIIAGIYIIKHEKIIKGAI